MTEVMGHRPIANNVNEEMVTIDNEVLDESVNTEPQAESPCSSSGSRPPSRNVSRRKRPADSDDDFSALRKEMNEQRQKDFAAIGEIIDKSTRSMVDGLTGMRSRFLPPVEPASHSPASHVPAAASHVPAAAAPSLTSNTLQPIERSPMDYSLYHIPDDPLIN